MTYNFKNKKILITGSTSCLCLVCAKNFIKKKLPRKKIGKAEEFLPLINLLCSSEGAILAVCESRTYNLN